MGAATYEEVIVRHAAETSPSQPSWRADKPLKLLSARPPKYPSELIDANTAGDVEAEVTFDERGNAVHVRILASPNELLAGLVREAMKSWRIEPATFKGVPKKVVVHQVFGFRVPSQ